MNVSRKDSRTFRKRIRDTDNMDKKHMKMLKSFYSQQKEGIEKLVPNLPEKLRDMLSASVADIDVVLAKLNVGEDADESSNEIQIPHIDTIKGVFSLVEALNTENKELSAQLAGLDGKIQEAINSKLQSGDLLTKEQLETAKTEAANTAKTAEQARYAMISGRRADLIKASLPIPATDELLEGSDEDFKATIGKVTSRIETLKNKDISFNAARTAKMAWCSDEDFSDQVALIEEDRAAKAVSARKQEKIVEPFANGSGNATSAVIRI